MEWINVKDRLPEVQESDYNSDTDKPTVMFTEYERAVVGGNVVFRWKWRDRISPWEVTHWMSLPEPPKENYI